MSALTTHIRVLRALGVALNAQAEDRRNRADKAQSDRVVSDAERQRWVGSFATAYQTLLGAADACWAAADQLEAEDAALKPPREGVDQPITYDPKGKR